MNYKKTCYGMKHKKTAEKKQEIALIKKVEKKKQKMIIKITEKGRYAKTKTYEKKLRYNKIYRQWRICEEIIGGRGEVGGGGKSKSEQSEVEESLGFWCSCKPPNRAGPEPRKFSDLCGS